jgi:hypothetical protein
MQGFKGSSGKHLNDRRVTASMFVEPLTPWTLPHWGIPHPIKSKVMSEIEPFWEKTEKKFTPKGKGFST